MGGKTILPVALMALAAQMAFAGGQRDSGIAAGPPTPEEYFEWVMQSNQAGHQWIEIIGYTGESTDVRIPAQIQGVYVRGIGNRYEGGT